MSNKHPTNTTNINELTYEILDLCISHTIPELGEFTREQFKAILSDTIGHTILTVRYNILANKIAEDKYPVTFEYQIPASWWQHFKLEKMPKFFTNRWSVKYTHKIITKEVKFSRMATYPMAKVDVPEFMGKVVIRDQVAPLQFWDEE